MRHTPLHEIASPRQLRTGGRLRIDPQGKRWLCNASCCLELDLRQLEDRPQLLSGDLLKVLARWDGECLHALSVELCFRPPNGDESIGAPMRQALEARAQLNEGMRSFFDRRGFLEVETPGWIPAPGTDVYLEPFEARGRGPRGEELQGYLHTSPEFAMKRLLCRGHERIYQICKVWRSGELGASHNLEFTILEWYRAFESVEAIMDDVEQLVRGLLRGEAIVGDIPGQEGPQRIGLEEPFERWTVSRVLEESCRLDLRKCSTRASLAVEMGRLDLMPLGAADWRWEELFAHLQLTVIEPFLAGRGAVFLTEWPARLAVLARKKPSDPQVAERFELYVGGVELANGFQELTDPVEQAQRFARELDVRSSTGRERLPMPERLLAALAGEGMPPSAGVAVGVDRLLMLKVGARDIGEVLPFCLRAEDGGPASWR